MRKNDNATAEFYVFEGNNRYSKYRYTSQKAEAAFKTLVNCVNCTNCENCTNCSDCRNCSDLKDAKNYDNNHPVGEVTPLI